MRIPNSILAAMAATLVLASCNNDENENGSAEPAKYITVNTSIGSLTRTTTANNGVQSFADKDRISVYAWTGSSDMVDANGLVVNNSINTYDGTKWSASPQMLWKDMITPHYFLGVYPDKAIADFAADAYTLDVTKQEQSDLLVAVNRGTDNAGFIATNTAVPLQFDHVMAKLIVNLTFRNQWATIPTVVSVTTGNLKSKATVNYLTKSATVTAEEATNIELQVATANTTYQSIMVPQTGDNATITIKIGEKNYIYNGTVKLEGGKYTTVNLIVGRDGITLGSVSINDWGAGTTINGGEAQE